MLRIQDGFIIFRWWKMYNPKQKQHGKFSFFHVFEIFSNIIRIFICRCWNVSHLVIDKNIFKRFGVYRTDFNIPLLKILQQLSVAWLNLLSLVYCFLSMTLTHISSLTSYYICGLNPILWLKWLPSTLWSLY